MTSAVQITPRRRQPDRWPSTRAANTGARPVACRHPSRSRSRLSESRRLVSQHRLAFSTMRTSLSVHSTWSLSRKAELGAGIIQDADLRQLFNSLSKPVTARAGRESMRRSSAAAAILPSSQGVVVRVRRVIFASGQASLSPACALWGKIRSTGRHRSRVSGSLIAFSALGGQSRVA